jgi:hypothetical protein
LKFVTVIICIISLSRTSQAQKLDSIFFNLYTDSLKKGTYNYINVDGKYSDGTYRPLTDKDLNFSASAGKFNGNSLFVDSSIQEDKSTVKVSLRSDPKIVKETTIYIKKYESNERLKTIDEILQPSNQKRSKKKQKIADSV